MEALLITREGEDEWVQESLFDTEAPPLLELDRTSVFEL
jgi:hypothetical protein